MNQKLLKQCVAEFIGTFTLIFIGVGAIDNLGSVPGGLLVGGKIDFGKTIAYWIGPLLGDGLAGLICGRLLIKESK